MMRDFLQWHAFGSGLVPDVVSKISSVSQSTLTRECNTLCPLQSTCHLLSLKLNSLLLRIRVWRALVKATAHPPDSRMASTSGIHAAGNHTNIESTQLLVPTIDSKQASDFFFAHAASVLFHHRRDTQPSPAVGRSLLFFLTNCPEPTRGTAFCVKSGALLSSTRPLAGRCRTLCIEVL